MALRHLIVISLILMWSPSAFAQRDSIRAANDSLPGRFYVIQKVDRGGEVLPEVEIKEVTVIAKPTREMKAARRKFDRLEYNIRKVYPYALVVRFKLDEVNRNLELIQNEKERKKYLKEVEKNVFGEYEDDMMNMTISQGRLLIKLIDRETQNTSYTLIKQYRGGLTAAFWQGIAKIFGTNLKDHYDPFGEDAQIEMIIKEIESGRL